MKRVHRPPVSTQNYFNFKSSHLIYFPPTSRHDYFYFQSLHSSSHVFLTMESIIPAVLLSALFVKAQSIPALPSCAASCVTTVCGGVADSNFQCFCDYNQEFNFEGCWSTNCNPGDIGSAYVALNSACGTRVYTADPDIRRAKGD